MSESKTPRRPGGRRPIPPLIFLVVLAILALGVWWKVIRTDEESSTASKASCTLTANEQQLADLGNLGNIKVHVLNGSGKTGLAATIQAELAGRGFAVLDIANAESGYPGVGKIEYGTGNEFQAQMLQQHLAGFDIDRSNQITDGTLAVTAGQQFTALADPNAAATGVQEIVAKQGKIVAGCPSEQAK